MTTALGKVTLYSYWRSTASWRVRIGLHYKRVPFEYVAVHLLKDGGEQYSADYRARNPMAQVPTLEWQEGGVVRQLSQSLAILDYLEERIPEPALLPRDPFLRARVRELAELVNAGIQPLQNLPILAAVKELGGDEKAFVRKVIERGLAALEARAHETAGRFLVGDAPTLADVCLVPQLSGARRFGAPVSARLQAVEAACNELPAFAAAAPDRQPDAAP